MIFHKLLLIFSQDVISLIQHLIEGFLRFCFRRTVRKFGVRINVNIAANGFLPRLARHDFHHTRFDAGLWVKPRRHRHAQAPYLL